MAIDSPNGDLIGTRTPGFPVVAAPKPVTATSSAIATREATHEPPKDVVREILETIAFVVVLVLLLKLFVAEAFVIPTGSMAETLWGEQSNVTCSSCGHRMQISASLSRGHRDNENEANYLCPNCGFHGVTEKVNNWSSGDRVLVAKYDFHFRDPRRFDVPVFKYPREPFEPTEQITMNYIKRLIGLPGETIAVYGGDLYVCRDIDYSGERQPDNPLNAWDKPYTYTDAYVARQAFDLGKFQLIRKTPDQILAVRRFVFDLDQQPKELQGAKRTRWSPHQTDGTGWEMLAAGFAHRGQAQGWVRYQHIQPGWKDANDSTNKTFIDDFLSYNLGDSDHWVPDIGVECNVEFRTPDATATLELSKGKDRFRATFSSGRCVLKRLTTENGIVHEQEMASVSTKVSTPGKYALRLANFDSRLTVWVDGKALDFGKKPDGQPAADYEAPDRDSRKFKPSENDISAPAQVGATGDVEVTKVRLFRDIYYVQENTRPEKRLSNTTRRSETDTGASATFQTFYVQPGHYLCFGDNSVASSDGRTWGLVPERLMLGRAVVIYWPYDRWRVIE